MTSFLTLKSTEILGIFGFKKSLLYESVEPSIFDFFLRDSLGVCIL